MAQILYDCPYCGSNTALAYEGENDDFVYAYCLICGLEGARYSISFYGKEKAEYLATTYWNFDYAFLDGVGYLEE